MSFMDNGFHLCLQSLIHRPIQTSMDSPEAKYQPQPHDSSIKHGMSTTVTDGGWTAHFGIPTILYGPGSLEEAHSVGSYQ
jgi:acetylornithine deacetylase/succinyl-diaminopimelate desuccinylase-like protein